MSSEILWGATPQSWTKDLSLSAGEASTVGTRTLLGSAWKMSDGSWSTERERARPLPSRVELASTMFCNCYRGLGLNTLKREELEGVVAPSGGLQEPPRCQRHWLRTIYHYRKYLHWAHLHLPESGYHRRRRGWQSDSGHQIHWCQVLPLNLRTRTAEERPPLSALGAQGEDEDPGLSCQECMLCTTLGLSLQRTGRG